MSEDIFSDADPPEVLWIRAEGADDAQRLLAVTALGMCRAVSLGVLSSDYACHRLFGPALLARLEQIDAPHPALRRAFQLATELEDVADVIPDKLSRSLAAVEAELLKALVDIAPTGLAGEKWMVRTL